MSKWYEKMRLGMRAKGLRHRDIAQHFGITQSAVGHWLAGRREPNISQVQEIARMLEIDMSELLSEDPVFTGVDEIKAAHYIQSMSPAQREAALSILKTLAETEGNDKSLVAL